MVEIQDTTKKAETTYDIGLGITSRCNARCKHCYSSSLGRQEDISLDLIQNLLSIIPVKSINLGTGEVGLHPCFEQIIEYILSNVSKVSITSNGLTLSRMSDDQLCRLHDVDISLDFPSAKKHDEFRGVRLFDLAIYQIDRCKKLGVKCSVATAVTSANIPYLLEMLSLVRTYDIALRLNLYKQVDAEYLTPNYEQFWNFFKVFFKYAKIVSCSEPILQVVLGMCHKEFQGSPCTHNSLRIRPNGQISRCVYLSGEENLYALEDHHILEKLNHIGHPKYIPVVCHRCKHVNYCQGGCESRRILTQGINMPDMYCPFIHGENIYIEPLIAEKDDSEDYIHSSYLCTLIVK
ncbi:Radical SAM domain protein [Limnospira maxima CS-328]|uniref:Radical SAM domain protein n=1 Tax=Limnospira maxima CS-328 TaxID=513049 RepID=B5VZB0_LIMMA|nr:radical SAM protein [Limnospira maxima]EDZ95311.1 Radical SAM domain protein [Limnospira maxima CS-328]MDC0839021.1 radical SAM protein [Limnoraphis robusta]